MIKQDLIELIIEADDKVFEELEYKELDKEFFEKLLLLVNKIEYVGDTDKIGYIEIDNEYIYVEPRCGYEFTSFNSYEGNSDSNQTDCFNYRWKIKKKY